MEEKNLMQQGVDSRAMFATFITKLPRLLILAVAGAVLGSGLYLLITLTKIQNACYISETEYYIAFAGERYEARDYYNAFTWNTVLGSDLVLGRAMELLGDEYEREQVGEMIRADIWSDVRYLTVTVKGRDVGQVRAIKDALEIALEELGTRMEEFTSIYKIEDSGITQEEIPYFAWRAALLGMVITTGAGIFAIALRFCMGSVFYTKRDITVGLGLSVCGMTFQEGRGRNGDSALERRQEEMLAELLMALTEKEPLILLMDAAGGRDAEPFLQEVQRRGVMDCSRFEIYGQSEQRIQDTAIVAVIPFGVTYREKITDEMDYARQRGGRIVAAVLTQADRNWTALYYV